MVLTLGYSAPTDFRQSPHVAAGTVAFNGLQRKFLQISLSDNVEIKAFSPKKERYLSNLVFHVAFVSAKKLNTHPYEAKDLSELLKQSFTNQYFAVGQPVLAQWDGNNLVFTVESLDLMDLNDTPDGKKHKKRTLEHGVLMPNTSVYVQKSPSSQIKISGGESTHQKQLFSPKFKFEDMGIGGLDQEFGNIFRRAFASRILPTAVIKKLGINHVRGNANNLMPRYFAVRTTWDRKDLNGTSNREDAEW